MTPAPRRNRTISFNAAVTQAGLTHTSAAAQQILALSLRHALSNVIWGSGHSR